MTNFCPALDLPPGVPGWNFYTYVVDHEYFISTNFRENPSSTSVVKADYNVALLIKDQER